jgi:hypothetical protein
MISLKSNYLIEKRDLIEVSHLYALDGLFSHVLCDCQKLRSNQLEYENERDPM